MNISFFEEDISFNIEHSLLIKNWINECVLNEGYKVEQINYIFCSDEYLKSINIEYLEHDYYTDIITFDNSEDENIIETDIFISIDRVKENEVVLKTGFKNELHRVMIHGILHLVGYGDKTEEEKLFMREKESSCLSLLKY